VWWVTAAFGAYFCVYGFRKPFTRGQYGGEDSKAVLLIAQTLGYMLSKFIGIKVIAEMPPHRRLAALLLLMGVAQAALLLFGLLPFPFNVACLFLNGLPLGLTFGLVLGFLEGRRLTEALTAGLCASFIVAGGVTKTVGAWVLDWGVSEAWMPFTAGLLFAPPLLLFVWMLSRIPPPSAADEAERSRRRPINRQERRRFFLRHALGLTPLILAFLLVTVLRSIRDDFMPEIWKVLGTEPAADVFARSEILVGLGVMLTCGLGVLIRDNGRAFFTAVGIALAGPVLMAGALLGWSAGWLGAFTFMVLLGLGLYLPYVAVHTTIFERLIALTRDRGNLGFLMYVADAAGYFGYVSLLLMLRMLLGKQIVANSFLLSAWVVGGATFVLLGLCGIFFAVRRGDEPAPQEVEHEP
jgi:hypothetical protein